MKGMMQKRIALLFVAILFILAIIPAFYPVEDESLSKDSPAYRAYGQLSAAFTIAHDFDGKPGWTRIASKLDTSLTLPSILPSTAESRAPPA